MTLRSWLEQNPFTLSLSSGFFGFFAHAGFVKALEENHLCPQRITGSSAGAIVGACVAGGMRAKEIEELLLRVRRSDFWDPFPGLGLLRGNKFEKLLNENLRENFSQLNIPLSVSGFNILSRQTESLFEGNLPRAVRASCAVPFMFHPVRIGFKFFSDGGILDKTASTDVLPTENVLCHYLESKSLIDSFERAPHLKKMSPHHKLIRLENIPRSGPLKLNSAHGKEIISVAYQATLKALNRSTT